MAKRAGGYRSSLHLNGKLTCVHASHKPTDNLLPLAKANVSSRLLCVRLLARHSRRLLIIGNLSYFTLDLSYDCKDQRVKTEN